MRVYECSFPVIYRRHDKVSLSLWSSGSCSALPIFLSLMYRACVVKVSVVFSVLLLCFCNGLRLLQKQHI